ncbi:MAG: DUF4397 domain-containing protein [Usitatibacter sp.]
MRFRHLLLLALLCLAGCGGSSRPQNSVDVRLLNAVPGSEPLDLLIDDGVGSSGVAFGTAGPYTNLTFGSRVVKVRSATTGEVLAQTEASFGPNGVYTMVAQGTRTAVTVVPMNEENTVSSGRIRLRLLGAAPESASLDLYITPTTDISAATPQVAGVPYSAVGTYVTLEPGSYAITLTQNGTKEVVFQAAPQEFSAGTRATIAALASAGGSLVSAVLLPTLGDARALANTLSRVKAVNAVVGSGPYNFRADSTLLFASVPYQGSSDYVIAASGARAVRIEPANVPGSAAASLAATLQPARDHTLIAAGTVAAPRLLLVTDDNTAPGATAARLRFANVRADGVVVEVRRNGDGLVAALGADTVTPRVSVTAAEAQTIEFVAGGGVVASTGSVTFEANGVYTVYLFGTASALATRIVRDR